MFSSHSTHLEIDLPPATGNTTKADKNEFQQDPRQPNKQSIPTGDDSYREPPPTPKYVTQRQKPAGLGTIGGKKPIGNSRTKSVSSTASDVSETPGASKAPRMSQETESDEELSPQRLNQTRKLHKSETHSRGLGVIGGPFRSISIHEIVQTIVKLYGKIMLPTSILIIATIWFGATKERSIVE